jgi:ferredoxin-NADP reductase
MLAPESNSHTTARQTPIDGAITVTEAAVFQPNAAYRELEAELGVIGTEAVADGVVAVSLADVDGGDLPEWTPGAHIDLLLAPTLVRQYSLCGDPADRSRWRIAVLLDPNSRGGSRYVHDNLAVGDRVRIRGPRNHFPLVSSPRFLFVAGGIGITPLLPMVKAADAAGADWRLVYGGRTRASMAFLDELERHGARLRLCPSDQQRIDLDEVLGEPMPDTLVYTCGPERLLTAVETMCQSWPAGTVHV